MKTKSKVITFSVLILLLLCLVGCVSSTNVTFYADADNTEVYVDGQYIGTTPMTVKLSNAIWDDPIITLKKDGYKTTVGSLNKEVKAVNVILGVCLDWPAFLWCYGPKSYQYYMLVPETHAE